jgi:hypothetical protein
MVSALAWLEQLRKWEHSLLATCIVVVPFVVLAILGAFFYFTLRIDPVVLRLRVARWVLCAVTALVLLAASAAGWTYAGALLYLAYEGRIPRVPISPVAALILGPPACAYIYFRTLQIMVREAKAPYAFTVEPVMAHEQSTSSGSRCESR